MIESGAGILKYYFGPTRSYGQRTRLSKSMSLNTMESWLLTNISCLKPEGWIVWRILSSWLQVGLELRPESAKKSQFLTLPSLPFSWSGKSTLRSVIRDMRASSCKSISWDCLTHVLQVQSHPWVPGHTTPHGQGLWRKGFQLHLQAVRTITIVKA